MCSFADIGADAASRLVHSVTGTAANFSDIRQAQELLYEEEKVVHADTCYLGVKKQLGVTYELQSAGTPLPSLPHSFRATSTMVLVDTTITLKVRYNFLMGTPGGRFMRVEVLADP